MAGGATSRRSQEIARAAREAAQTQVIEVDPQQVPAMATEEFRTAFIVAESVDEVRDEHDKVETAAQVVCTFKEPPLIAQLGDQIVARGGTWRITRIGPELAIAVGEELAKLGREAMETRKEQPVNSTLVATAADLKAATAAADVAQDLKGAGT